MCGKASVIFGGSGFVGKHLLHNLRASHTGPLISFDLRDPVEGVRYMRADVRDLSSLRLDMDIGSIFNLAATHTTPGHMPWEYYATNVTGATQIARFARRHDVHTICFTSSISVYGPDETEKSETTVPAPVSDYGRSKVMAEQIFLDWQAEDARHRLSIARPAVVFGHGEGGNFTRLTKMLEKIPAALLKGAASALRQVSAAVLGVHPERIEKFMVSTNVRSQWAEAQGLEQSGGRPFV